MAKERLPFLLRFMYNRPGFPWLAIIILGILPWTLMGCAPSSVTDWRGSRYYYNIEKCPWEEDWLRIVEQTASIQVLPWSSYRKVAWGHGVQPDSLGFQQGWAIWIQEGYQLDTLFHEISHIHDWRNGRTGHNSECWMTYKPHGYDDMVVIALGSHPEVIVAGRSLDSTLAGLDTQASLPSGNF